MICFSLAGKTGCNDITMTSYGTSWSGCILVAKGFSICIFSNQNQVVIVWRLSYDNIFIWLYNVFPTIKTVYKQNITSLWRNMHVILPIGFIVLYATLTLYSTYMSRASSSSPASMARMMIHRGTMYWLSGLFHITGVRTCNAMICCYRWGVRGHLEKIWHYS